MFKTCDFIRKYVLKPENYKHCWNDQIGDKKSVSQSNLAEVPGMGRPVSTSTHQQ